jgi:cardiolipin synthase
VTDGTRRHSRISRLKNGVEFYPAHLKAIRRAKTCHQPRILRIQEGQIGDEMSGFADRTRRGRGRGAHHRRRARAASVPVPPTSMACALPAARCAGTTPSLEYLAESQQPHPSQAADRGWGDGFYRRCGHCRPLAARTSVPVWRDTVFCVEGEAVAGLISAFCENWLESSGEILSSSSNLLSRHTRGRRKLCRFQHAPRRRHPGAHSLSGA